ncbi:hypothetical protein [Rhodococcus opacus]
MPRSSGSRAISAQTCTQLPVLGMTCVPSGAHNPGSELLSISSSNRSRNTRT